MSTTLNLQSLCSNLKPDPYFTSDSYRDFEFKRFFNNLNTRISDYITEKLSNNNGLQVEEGEECITYLKNLSDSSVKSGCMYPEAEEALVKLKYYIQHKEWPSDENIVDSLEYYKDLLDILMKGLEASTVLNEVFFADLYMVKINEILNKLEAVDLDKLIEKEIIVDEIKGKLVEMESFFKVQKLLVDVGLFPSLAEARNDQSYYTRNGPSELNPLYLIHSKESSGKIRKTLNKKKSEIETLVQNCYEELKEVEKIIVKEGETYYKGGFSEILFFCEFMEELIYYCVDKKLFTAADQLLEIVFKCHIQQKDGSLIRLVDQVKRTLLNKYKKKIPLYRKDFLGIAYIKTRLQKYLLKDKELEEVKRKVKNHNKNKTTTLIFEEPSEVKVAIDGLYKVLQDIRRFPINDLFLATRIKGREGFRKSLKYFILSLACDKMFDSVGKMLKIFYKLTSISEGIEGYTPFLLQDHDFLKQLKEILQVSYKEGDEEKKEQIERILKLIKKERKSQLFSPEKNEEEEKQQPWQEEEKKSLL